MEKNARFKFRQSNGISFDLWKPNYSIRRKINKKSKLTRIN